MSERITALQEGRVHAVYDIKVTKCLWRQLFREVFILFGLLVYCICHSLCTHLCVYAHFFVWRTCFLFLLILSSWQVLLGVIDKRQSLANECVIFKLSKGYPCETAELKNEPLDRVQATTTPRLPLLLHTTTASNASFLSWEKSVSSLC